MIKKINKAHILTIIFVITLVYLYLTHTSVLQESPLKKDIRPIETEASSHVNAIKINNNIIKTAPKNTNQQVSINKNVNHEQNDKTINQQMLQLQEDFKARSDNAFGYFMNIRNFSAAFENDKYDPLWSNNMIMDITDTVLFDQENSINRFPAIAVDELDCRGTLCKIDFSNISDSVEDWDTQRAALRDALLRLGGTENQGNRAVKTTWLENGGIRYYISKGISDLE
jgi:hypothetical protein